MLGATLVLYFPLYKADLFQIEGNARCANTKAAIKKVAIASSAGVFSQAVEVC